MERDESETHLLILQGRPTELHMWMWGFLIHKLKKAFIDRVDDEQLI